MATQPFTTPLRFCLGVIGLSFLAFAYAEPTARIYPMPNSLQQQLKTTTQQRSNGECAEKKEFDSTKFYALNQQLLILLGLPDYFCHAATFTPLLIDRQGHWQIGTMLESLPSELWRDSSGQLWLLSYFEHEAVMPYLHHSNNGIDWQEISLPKGRQVDCCFEYIRQVCISGNKITLKFSGIDEKQIEYWQTSLADSLKPQPAWQKLSETVLADVKVCENKTLAAGDWQRQLTKNGRQVLLQSAKEGFKVLVPRWAE